MKVCRRGTSLRQSGTIRNKTVDGAPAYATLRRHAERIKLDGLSVLVASIDDLISMKRAAARPIDMTDLEALEAIKRLRRSG